MKNEFLDNFFYYFSKIIIFFPLVLVVFGLLTKFNQKSTNVYINNKVNVLPTKIIFSPTSSFQPVKFDLKGPWLCLFENKTASVSAYIKDKKIRVEIKTDKEKFYFLINNNCLYQWQENQFSGEKSCGIGQYLTFAENILNNDQKLFMDLFFKQFNNLQEFSFSDNCKNKEINEEVFLVPRTVLFKNKPLNL